MRVFIGEDPYPYVGPDAGVAWGKRGIWPAKWVGLAKAPEPPFVAAYRLRFSTPEAATVRVHVSADERYELFLDGKRVGRGPERGDAENWFFETYDLTIPAGEHVLVARVWSLGFERMPFAQMSVRHGFLLSPQGEEHRELLATGVAPWEGKRLGGYEFVPPMTAWGTGHNAILHGDAFDWGHERGDGDGWAPVVAGEDGSTQERNDSGPVHRLTPAVLPPMLDEPRRVGTVRLVSDPGDAAETHGIPIRAADDLPEERAAWQRLLRGEGGVTVPAEARRRVVIDLDDYYCAYPVAVTSGGKSGRVRVHWQESLYDEPEAKNKGDRNAVEGKYFVTVWHLKDGVGDVFLPDGGQGRTFETLWWQCGRYVEVLIEAKEEPLTLDDLHFRETRYPLEPAAEFQTGDARLTGIIPIAVRALQMCAHETYMDCPYYEQLQYAGDTRLEILTTYCLTPDDRLPKKAIRMFAASRLPSGLTQSRYPSRVRQVIPPFSLWWVGMLHDHALWRGGLPFVAEMMPTVRGVLDAFLARRGADGLVRPPAGWNYVDWVPDWKGGIPPSGEDGVNAPVNLQLALALTQAADLENWLGEPEMASRDRRLAAELSENVLRAFWDEGRGLLADDPAHSHFSEHSQCLALLAGAFDAGKRSRVAGTLLSAPDLARTTIYFTHYLFEAFRALGRPDALRERLSLWFELEKNGLKTTVEQPEPTRSDCHAWGAHPVFHYHATLLGVRPTAPGFTEVEVAPQLGALGWAKGRLPHPNGEIVTDLRQEGGAVTGEITLPEGVTGVFRAGGTEQALAPGRQTVGSR